MVRAEEFQQFNYTWLDDKQEVIYGMRFVDPWEMTELVSKIYVKDKSLYIVPNPVVVNPLNVGSEGINTDVNQVESWVYANILWWDFNKANSENVTLIAWHENVVAEWNDNATFLWWERNKEISINNGTPIVVVWWVNNQADDDHDAVALIWWDQNKVWARVSNVFLLWWWNNRVGESRENVIVWWTKVNVKNNTNNIFVYSNSNNEFAPESSNAFYLNVGGGVGINTDASAKGLAVLGAVNLGEIDIIHNNCTESDIWVKWSYKGCIVWCTKTSADDGGKWELLDRGGNCQNICKNAKRGADQRCTYEVDNIPAEPDYKAFCTKGVVDTENAELCFPDELSGYQNVIFETSLIDNGRCDELKGKENKCVYQCMSGYHLAADKTKASNLSEWDKGKTKCFLDCDLVDLLWSEWSDYVWQAWTGKIRHGDTVIAYNKLEVPLSYHRYGKLEWNGYTINDYLDDGLGRKAYRKKWIGLDNSVSYTLPEHCENNAHRQRLVCANGALYIAKNTNGEAESRLATEKWTLGDTYLWYEHDGYIHRTCETKEYRCDTGVNAYEYTRDQILAPFDSWLNDNDQGKTRTRKDRNLVNLTRWQYKLCLDYDVVEGKNNTWKVVNTGNPYNYHYKWVKCQNWYTEYPKGSHKCMQKCTVTPLDKTNPQSWEHSSVVEFYLSWSAICTGVCESLKFVCDDGTFYLSWSVGDSNKTRQKLNYKYKDCTLHDNMCDRDEYNVKAADYEQWKDKWEYVSCDDYANKYTNLKVTKYHPKTSDTAYNKECKKYDTRYKLIECKPWYHTLDGMRCIDNVWDESCGSLSSHAHWVRQTGPLEEYPRDDIITKYKTQLSAGHYLRWWDESCDWNGSQYSCETDELQDINYGKVIPEGACQYECNTWYVDIGDRDCREIDTSCAYPNQNPNSCTNETPYGCVDEEARTTDEWKNAWEGEWRWKCTNGLKTNSCLLCKDGYHIENSKCVKNKDGVCNNSVLYGCNPWSSTEGDKNEEETRYTWNCLGIDGPNGSTNEWPGCTNANTGYDCYKCKEGYHTTSVYGECEINKYTVTYDGNGWTPDRSSDIVDHGSYVDSLPGAQRTCYEFGGWKKGVWTRWEWDKYGPVKSDVTLTASWNPVKYTITYDCGNGTELTQEITWWETPNLRGSGCDKVGYKLIWWSKTPWATEATWATWVVINGELANQCDAKTLYPVYRNIINGACNESEPYWCMNDNDNPVEKGFIESNDSLVGVSWYCLSEDNVKSRKCEYRCEDGEYFDAINKVCVEVEEQESLCCNSVPSNANQIIKNSNELYVLPDDAAPLCQPYEYGDESYNGTVSGEDGCWYAYSDWTVALEPCAATQYCCLWQTIYGQQQLTCNPIPQTNCTTTPSSPKTLVVWFKCKDGYTLSWCDCVLEKIIIPDPIIDETPRCWDEAFTCLFSKVTDLDRVNGTWKCIALNHDPISCNCLDKNDDRFVKVPACPRWYDLSSSDNKCHLNYRFCAVPANCNEIGCTARSDVKIDSCFDDTIYARNFYGVYFELPPRLYGRRWSNSFGNEFLWNEAATSDFDFIVQRYEYEDISCYGGIATLQNPLNQCNSSLIKYNGDHGDNWYYLTSCAVPGMTTMDPPCEVEVERPINMICPMPIECPNSCQYLPGSHRCVKTCFIAWTKVIMADGSQKNIEDVKVWEKLLSESGSNTVLWYYRPKLWNRHLRSINGGEYFVSDEHPFMTTEWWKSFDPEMTKQEVDLDVTKLKVWDVLITVDGYEVIRTLDFIDSDEDTQLYNFVLDGDHTYYADGYLVHNKQLYYQTETASEPVDNVCPKGTDWASAWDRWCCPENLEYYLQGHVCYALCDSL